LCAAIPTGAVHQRVPPKLPDERSHADGGATVTLITKRTERPNQTLSTRAVSEAFACRCRGKISCLACMTHIEEDARLYGCGSGHALCPRRFSERRTGLRNQGRRPSFARLHHRQDRHGKVDAPGEHGAPRPGARARFRPDRPARRSRGTPRGARSSVAAAGRHLSRRNGSRPTVRLQSPAACQIGSRSPPPA